MTNQDFAEFFDATRTGVLTVLADGKIDRRSRDVLAALYRDLSNAGARTTKQPPALDPTDDDDWAWWLRVRDHVGSILMLTTSVPYVERHALFALEEARLGWCDEVDAMTDKELRRIPGIGPKALKSIRDTLDTYYWRGVPDVSRAMWEYLARRLTDALERERDGDLRTRLVDGIALAQRVLEDSGACLADTAHPRMVA